MLLPRPSLLVSALTGGALALTACGERAPVPPTEQAQVRAAVRRFGVASAQRDYRLICARLIARQLADNVEQIGLPCEAAFKRGLESVLGAKLRVDGVRVTGTTAFAEVHTTATNQPPSDDTLKLVKVGGAWRIVSLSAGDDPGARRAPAKKKQG